MEIIIHPYQGIEIPGKGRISFGMTRKRVRSFFSEQPKEIMQGENKDVLTDCYYQASIRFFYQNPDLLQGIAIEAIQNEHNVIFQGQHLMNKPSQQIETWFSQVDANLEIEEYVGLTSHKFGIHISVVDVTEDPKDNITEAVLVFKQGYLDIIKNIYYNYPPIISIFPLNIVVERQLSNEEIVAACTKVFSLSPNEIIVVEDISKIDTTKKDMQLFCERTFINGDFKIYLSFYSENSLVEERVEKEGDELSIAQKLCEAWHTKCLVKDNSPIEDYEEDAYFLVQEKVEPQLVYIDLDKLDDDLYVLFS